MSLSPFFVESMADSPAQTFHEAISKLASFVNASGINEAGTSISIFKAQYPDVLNRTDDGSLEVITRNKRRYVILDESHLMALTKNVHTEPLAADLLSDLVLLPQTEDRPRAHLREETSVRFGRLPG